VTQGTIVACTPQKDNGVFKECDEGGVREMQIYARKGWEIKRHPKDIISFRSFSKKEA